MESIQSSVPAAEESGMKLDAICVACYKYDVDLTRICVASIRTWYPKIPISLLKDETYGAFNTREIEQSWDVQVHPASRKALGWGFGKLDMMMELPTRRLLILDSDIVFVGRVIERLEQFTEDVVVHEEPYTLEAVEQLFFPVEKLRQLDPGFAFPGYAFNTGQLVVKTGCLARADFQGLADWETRKVTQPDIFKMGEQGLANYVILRKLQRRELSLRREPFMLWPGDEANTSSIRVSDLTPDSPHPALIHWAGLRWGKSPEQMPRADILLHFQRIYYSRVPYASCLKLHRRVRASLRRNCLGPLARLVRSRAPREKGSVVAPPSPAA
jgi:hypothetical protein